MDLSPNALEENRRIRRAMRDLVALSTLPAIWSGLSSEAIAHSLGEVLLNTLSLEVVFIRLADPSGDSLIEQVHRTRRGDAAQDEMVKASLASLVQTGHAEAPSSFRLGAETLQVAVTRFGIGANQGALVACSRNLEFPTEQDRLLLGVAANQTAIVIQNRSATQQVNEQREWLHVTLASIRDAVITTDVAGRITYLNATAAELTGWTADEAKHQPLKAVFAIVDEESRIAIDNPVERVLRDGSVTGLANHTLLVARNGTEHAIDDSAAPIRDSSGRIIGVVMVFRGITAQRKAEQHRNARFAVTQTLNQATSITQMLEDILKAVCNSLGWDVGLFWDVDEDNACLACRASWHRQSFTPAEFVTESWNRKFQSGEGLPGRVWATRKPAWVRDLSKDINFLRISSATTNGLRSAFACPVMVGQRVAGVIEFFTTRLTEPDPDLLETIGTVAANIAHFIERTTAGDEIRRSEEELAEFFENATVGMHWVGPDGTILRANRAELNLLGYGREEYIGRPIADFHADERVICDILDRLKAGEKLSEYPARLRCKDGSIRDVLIDSSVMWKDREFVHTRCFTRDVTDRKRAEAALADARSQLDAALEAGAIATWTWDIPNNRLFADRRLARMFNLPPEDAAGGLLEKYIHSIHPDDAPVVTAALDRSVATGEDYTAEYRIVQADGQLKWVTARGRVDLDAAGKAARMTGVLIDISDMKRMEEALREADRRKDEFLATLAHELRNPLAPIRNSLQILKMPRVDAAMLREARDMMERQVEALVRLVDDLLDVARVMRGKIELRKESVELATVVARAVETAQSLIELQGHRLELALPQESLLVNADPVRLAQVLANLLTNAAKYTEPHGHIWLCATREANEVVVRVRDDGIGIATDMLPRVFDLFVQADHASTRSQGGLGIGLTLVKNLAEMHGGSIGAYSAGLRTGSEFTLRLPLMLEDGEATNKQTDDESREGSACSGHRLLVVDDNKDAAMSLAMLLRLQGHDVRTAHDGASALAMASSFLPKIVFLDIGMPDMDGYQVARRMREQPGLQSVVLAALTGWGQEEDRRRTTAAGFDYHLVKPPELKALQSVLDNL